jgi:hypothetical protein
MKASKLFIVLLLLGSIGYQIFLVANYFFSTRTIEIQKEIYDNDEKEYLKGYDIVNVPFEQFDIKVQPKDFFDYLLLTNGNGNLLSIIFETVASCWLAWFIYRLEPDHIFIEYFKSLKWPILLLSISFLTHSYGLEYTRDFWKTIFVHRGKTDFWKHDFYVNTKNHYTQYAFILLFLGSFYQSIIYYYRKATIKS